MALQFRKPQIADNAIDNQKLDLSTTGLTYDFGGIGLVYKANQANITLSSEVATKGYVDAVAQGLYWKDAVVAASTADIGGNYNNGSSGVGATLTNTASPQSAFDLDNAGSAIGGFSVGDRVLIKNQTDAEENGIYEVTTVGNGSTNWVLTRTADMDLNTEFMSSAVFVSAGDTNANVGFVCTTNVDTIGTDDVNFTAFTGADAITAGAGLSKTGSTLAVQITANAGLGFNAVGDNGTLEVKLGSNKGLKFNGSSADIEVDYDDSTIGIVSNKLAVKADGITLGQAGFRYQSDEFNAVGATIFTLTQAISSANFKTGASVQVFRNGQRLRVGANMGSGMDSGACFVFVDGSDTKVALEKNSPLVSGEIVIVDYIR